MSVDPYGVKRCRSCQAQIVWVRTPAGRLMPLDAEPTPDGNVELRDGIAIVHGQPTLEAGELFMPHHATCPQADEWKGQHR